MAPSLHPAESLVTVSITGDATPWVCQRRVVILSSVATPALSAVSMAPAFSTPAEPAATIPFGARPVA